MELDRTQRWMLVNQYRILAAVDKSQDNKRHCERAIDALSCGYEAEYEHFVQSIYEKGLSEEQCREVVEIMAMCEAALDVWNAMADKGGIIKAHIDFAGFDNNTEAELLNYASFICDPEERRFVSLGPVKNSHIGMLGSYRRRLVEWRKSADPQRLSAADVRRIADASPHPDR